MDFEIFSRKKAGTRLLGSRVFPTMIGGAIGEEGWQTLAQALQGKTHVVKMVNISRHALTDARDNIKDIWDATRYGIAVLREDESICCLPLYKSRCDWENVWIKLKRISQMTAEEFTVECQPKEDKLTNFEAEGEYSEEEEIEDEDHDGGKREEEDKMSKEEETFEVD